ncbi:MAG: glycosyltransferase [Immundisolibacteraceae bacterium]|nr:glycosyltransferase [Immundisolibacteraceae bacterium]
MSGAVKKNDSSAVCRVLQLASGDLWAGAEVQLFHLACYLQESAKVELRVVLLNSGELQQRLQAAGVAVTVISESKHGFFRLMFLLLGISQEFRSDVIHTHRQKENLLGSVVALLSGIRSMRTVHGADEHPPQRKQILKRLRNFADRFAGRWFQYKVVSVSADLAAKLSTLYRRGQVITIANGVDVSAVQSAAIEQRRELPADPIKVAFVGRMVAVKRIDLFVDIARLAGQQAPGQFQFYAIGDGPMLELAQRQAAGYGLGEQLVFTGFRADSLGWLAAMDCLCIVSDHEGLPMVLLEAMALNVLVVAREVGGIGQALHGGAAGKLIAAADPQQFVDALTALSGDVDLSAQYRLAASSWLVQHFSVEVMAEQYIVQYLAK